MALAVTEDGESVFSASYDGLICILFIFLDSYGPVSTLKPLLGM